MYSYEKDFTRYTLILYFNTDKIYLTNKEQMDHNLKNEHCYTINHKY